MSAIAQAGADELLALLPERVVELVDVIGLTAALKLVEAHGGTHIWVPKHARLGHWLAILIGLEALERLCAYYDSTQVEIPLCAKMLRMIKERAIVAEFEQGASNNQLARKHGTTDRTIRRIRQRAGNAVPVVNLDLFEEFL